MNQMMKGILDCNITVTIVIIMAITIQQIHSFVINQYYHLITKG